MIEMELKSNKDVVEVVIDGKIFTEYRFGHYACRPFLYPMLTPEGTPLTRGFPIDNIEGETQDHYHHRSVYTAHGLVNGFNLWDESLNHGIMLQRGQPKVGMIGDAGQIDGIVDWFGPNGEQLLEERRTIQISCKGLIRILNHTSEFRACHGEVKFGDTKEGGLYSIRVPTSMDAKGNGRIENSEGQIYQNGQGVETTWGVRAEWVDYSGPLSDGVEWGHTVVDHCQNPLYPTYWHVRGYGLFTANPFGVHDFKGDDSIDGSWVIPNGETRTFRFCHIVHPGRGIDGCDGVREIISTYQSFDV
ncbi:MAG: hypothetical protein CME10_03810 [Gemmatimonadetes bacterium]|nr:hypothetical protein [Gemmatimonadota bacterium]